MQDPNLAVAEMRTQSHGLEQHSTCLQQGEAKIFIRSCRWMWNQKGYRNEGPQESSESPSFQSIIVSTPKSPSTGKLPVLSPHVCNQGWVLPSVLRDYLDHIMALSWPWPHYLSSLRSHAGTTFLAECQAPLICTRSLRPTAFPLPAYTCDTRNCGARPLLPTQILFSRLCVGSPLLLVLQTGYITVRFCLLLVKF